jgi:hypothetical protein
MQQHQCTTNGTQHTTQHAHVHSRHNRSRPRIVHVLLHLPRLQLDHVLSENQAFVTMLTDQLYNSMHVAYHSSAPLPATGIRHMSKDCCVHSSSNVNART